MPTIFCRIGLKPRLQRRFEDVVFVRIDRTLDDVFAQSVSGVDQHGIAEASFRVDREHDPGGAEIGAHHALHANGKRDLEMIEAFVDAVRNRAVGE